MCHMFLVLALEKANREYFSAHLPIGNRHAMPPVAMDRGAGYLLRTS